MPAGRDIFTWSIAGSMLLAEADITFS
jgi:hypothetical protein